MDTTQKSKRNRHGNRGKKKENPSRIPSAKEMLLPQAKAVKHSTLPIPPVKNVQEPCPVCPDCGQPITEIEEALTGPDGQYRHFDCVLKSLAEQEKPTETQKLSYVGSGNFAIFEKSETGSWVTVKTIPYESRERFDAMKKYVEGIKA